MNELFNIIKNSLRTNSYYVPSQNNFVNGSSLTIKQYNDILELDASVDFGFEQYIKYSILTDTILKENIDNSDALLYFDKPFVLAQIKMTQENDFLGLSMQRYQEEVKNRMSTISLSSFDASFTSNNLAVKFGLNKYSDVQQINKNFFDSVNNNFNNAGNVITLEVFKFLKEISYLNQSLGDVKNVKELKPLIEQLPAVLIEPFNELLQNVNSQINDISTFNINGENFVFNPTIEFMLS